MERPERTLTVYETAKRLGRSLEQVRRYLREGKLPGERIGSQWFVRETAVAYLVERKAPEMKAGRAPYPKTVRSMTAEERMNYVARVEARRGDIGYRWERECVRVDVVEALREERESH